MTELYLDNHILVADKPWGLLTQPSGTSEDSLEQQCRFFIKELFHKPGAVFLEAVHRIDRVVGGAVLFARTSKALSRLNEMQRRSAIRKIYRARVFPSPSKAEGELAGYILHEDFRARMVPKGTPDAKFCALNYCVKESYPDGTALLEIDLRTGRYHQIRAQLADAGMPIAGDTKYGGSRLECSPSGGIALLSYALDFEHPVTHEQLHIVSSLNQELACPEITVQS